MTEETLEPNAQGQERPTFLTVLCILTFIGSGLGLIGGLVGLFGGSFLSFLTGGGGTTIAIIVGLVASVLCLLGAIRMWGLYKQGFILYLVGALLAIVGSIISATTMGAAVNDAVQGLGEINNEAVDAQASEVAGAVASGFAWMGVVWAVIINGLFIGLYAANKKALVK